MQRQSKEVKDELLEINMKLLRFDKKLKIIQERRENKLPDNFDDSEEEKDILEHQPALEAKALALSKELETIRASRGYSLEKVRFNFFGLEEQCTRILDADEKRGQKKSSKP